MIVTPGMPPHANVETLSYQQPLDTHFPPTPAPTTEETTLLAPHTHTTMRRWTGCLSGLSPLLLLLLLLLCATFSPVASEAHCALRPYGRPSPRDCAFVSVHQIPDKDEAEGFVLYTPPAPFIRLPIIWYFRQFSLSFFSSSSLLLLLVLPFFCFEFLSF